MMVASFIASFAERRSGRAARSRNQSRKCFFKRSRTGRHESYTRVLRSLSPRESSKCVRLLLCGKVKKKPDSRNWPSCGISPALVCDFLIYYLLFLRTWERKEISRARFDGQCAKIIYFWRVFGCSCALIMFANHKSFTWIVKKHFWSERAREVKSFRIPSARGWPDYRKPDCCFEDKLWSHPASHPRLHQSLSAAFNFNCDLKQMLRIFSIFLDDEPHRFGVEKLLPSLMLNCFGNRPVIKLAMTVFSAASMKYKALRWNALCTSTSDTQHISSPKRFSLRSTAKERRKKLPEKSIHCLSSCWRLEESFDERFFSPLTVYNISELLVRDDHYNFCNNKPQNEFESVWHLKHNSAFVSKMCRRRFNCRNWNHA